MCFITKADFCCDFSAFYGQRSVAEPGPTPSPWSILIYWSGRLACINTSWRCHFNYTLSLLFLSFSMLCFLPRKQIFYLQHYFNLTRRFTTSSYINLHFSIFKESIFHMHCFIILAFLLLFLVAFRFREHPKFRGKAYYWLGVFNPTDPN